MLLISTDICETLENSWSQINPTQFGGIEASHSLLFRIQVMSKYAQSAQSDGDNY
jgi:hypothetical protein